MQLILNIEKKYLWFIILAVVAVGVVVAFGGNNPPVMGHNFGEIEGVPINCIEGQSYSSCQALSGAPAGTWTDRRQIAAFSSVAFDAERLGGAAATQYCRTDGTNCPAGVRSTTVHKIPANYNCQNSAFLCATANNQIVGPFVASPSWNSPQGVWTYRYWNGNNAAWTTQNCAWVLCSQPDPALP